MPQTEPPHKDRGMDTDIRCEIFFRYRDDALHFSRELPTCGCQKSKTRSWSAPPAMVTPRYCHGSSLCTSEFHGLYFAPWHSSKSWTNICEVDVRSIDTNHGICVASLLLERTSFAQPSGANIQMSPNTASTDNTTSTCSGIVRTGYTADVREVKSSTFCKQKLEN